VDCLLSASEGTWVGGKSKRKLLSKTRGRREKEGTREVAPLLENTGRNIGGNWRCFARRFQTHYRSISNKRRKRGSTARPGSLR